jgi:hypothetical protein
VYLAVVLAVVVTNTGYSDLSTTRWLGPEVLELQIRREGFAYYVDAKVYPGSLALMNDLEFISYVSMTCVSDTAYGRGCHCINSLLFVLCSSREWHPFHAGCQGPCRLWLVDTLLGVPHLPPLHLCQPVNIQCEVSVCLYVVK